MKNGLELVGTHYCAPHQLASDACNVTATRQRRFAGLASRRWLSATLSIICAVLASACGPGGVHKQVRPNDKDPLFIYDGNYRATVKHRGGRQEMGNGWYIDCNSVNYTIPIKIANSVVTWQVDDDTETKTYVDRNGKFRLEQPLDADMRVIGGVASDGRRTMVIQGIVHRDRMEGRFVYEVAQFNGRGCTYPVEYTAIE